MANNTALALFDPAALPAHIVEAMEDGESNILTRGGGNALTFPGKVWHITINGEKRPILRKNEEGEEEPVAIFNAIILAYPERRGRAYYEGAYNPERESAPSCWSNDGIESDPNSTKRQSVKCAKCPLSAKGSKQTDDGRNTVACSEHLMVAVVPAARIGEFAPLRLRLAITSVWDAKSPEHAAQGWFAFQQYMDFLKSKRANKTYMLTTRIKFDTKTNYPKLLFSPGKWLTQEQYDAVKGIITNQATEIDNILKTEFTPGRAEDAAAPAGLEDEDDGLGEAPAPVPSKPKPKTPTPAAAAPAPAPKAKAAPAPAPVVEEEDEAPEEEAAPAPAPVVAKAPDPKVEAAKKAAAARKAAAVVEDEDGEAPAPAPVKAPKASGKAQAATPAVASSPAVSAVLSDWDD